MTHSQPVLPTRYLDLLFFVGFALLACHELDAVAQAEWRLLPFLSQMADEDAYTVFVFLHVPLFALLMWWTSSTSALVRFRAQLSVDAFMVIHVGLHMLFRLHADYTFHSALSQVCIFGAGAVGLAHALLAMRARNRSVPHQSQHPV